MIPLVLALACVIAAIGWYLRKHHSKKKKRHKSKSAYIHSSRTRPRNPSPNSSGNSSGNGTSLPLKENDENNQVIDDYMNSSNIMKMNDIDVNILQSNNDDGIFNKIYSNNKILLNISEEHKNENINNNKEDLIPPNEDSWSSNAAEQLYVPQTHTSTTKPGDNDGHDNDDDNDIMSQLQLQSPPMDAYNGLEMEEEKKEHDVYDLENIKKSYSFNDKIHNKKNNKSRKDSYIQSQSNSYYDLALQHQVTIAISDKNGLKINQSVEIDDNDDFMIEPKVADVAFDGEGYNENDETIVAMDNSEDEEDEEDEDLDIYHGVAAPSSGPNHGSYSNIARQRLKSKEQAPTPELELYGHGQINDGVSSKQSGGSVRGLGLRGFRSSNDNDNELDDSDDLYGRGNDPLSSPGLQLKQPTKRHVVDKSIEALYNLPPARKINDNDDNDEETEGSGDYEWIEGSLKVCDDIEWRKYLQNFKDNKVSDHRLGQLSDNDWKDLIPKIGPRNEFKALWMQWKRQRAQSHHL